MLGWSLELLGTIVYLYTRLVTTNPIAIGGTLAALIFMIQRHHSGSFNPALDLAHIFANNTNKWRVLRHLTAQIIGAIIAGLIYQLTNY